MAINVTHLRSFFHVAEALSFTKAAETARVSQPTLTRQIAALERAYGVELVDRTTSRVDLTQEGHRLLDLCRPVFRGLEDTEEFLKSQHTRSIRIDAVMCAVLPELLSHAYEKFPNLRFDVRGASSTDVLRQLSERRTDFGFLTLPPPPLPEGLEHLLVYRSRLVAMVDKGHPWASRGAISFRELAGQRVILGDAAGASRRLVDQNFERFGIAPNVVQVVNSFQLMIDLVERGIGIAVTGGTGVGDRRFGNVLTFEEASTTIDVHLACRRERLRTQPFRSFFNLAKSTIAQTDREQERG